MQTMLSGLLKYTLTIQGTSMTQPNHFITTAKNYVKTVSREIRDIPTAAGTVAKTIANAKAAKGTVNWTSTSEEAVRAAASDFKKQSKEVIEAASSGKSGTTAAESKTKRKVISGTKR